MSNTISKKNQKAPAKIASPQKAKLKTPVKKKVEANSAAPKDRTTVSREARSNNTVAAPRVDLSWGSETVKDSKSDSESQSKVKAPTEQKKNTPKAPTEVSAKKPKVATEDAVVSLEKELDKGGPFAGKPDSRKINEVVAQLTPEQLKQLPAEYKTAYDGRLNEFASQNQELQLRLKGKSLEADTHAIKESLKRPRGLTGNGVREKDLFAVLERQNPENRKALVANLKEQGVDLESLSRDKKFNKNERSQFQALLSGDEAKQADLAVQKNGGLSKIENLQKLSRLSDDDRKEWLKRNPNAAQQVKIDYPAGPERDRAIALLEGDSSSASAAEIRQITEGKGNNTANAKKVRDLIDSTPPKEREQLFENLKEQTGQDFGTYLAEQEKDKKLESRDIKRLNSLKDGKLTDNQRVQWALDGKKEKDQIERVLGGKSADEVAKLNRQFQKDTGKSLHATVKQRFSGRDEFQLGQALRGKPQDVAEQVQRLNEARAFERDGNPFNNFTDFWTNDGKVLDRQTAKANQQLTAAQADGVITEEEKQALGKTTSYGQSDVRSYQESKDKIADTASSIATTVAVTTVAAATGGAALPIALAATATAGAGTKLLTKSAIAGRSYRDEDKVADGFSGAVEGLSAVAGGRLGNQFVHGRKAGKVLEQGNKGWAGKGINKLVSGQGKYLDTTRKVLSSSINEATSGVITGSIDGFAKSTWDAVESREFDGDPGALAWQVGGNTVKQGIVTGVVGGVVGGLLPGEQATEAASSKFAKRLIKRTQREAQEEVADDALKKVVGKGYDFAKGQAKSEAVEKPVESVVDELVKPVYADYEEATEQE